MYFGKLSNDGQGVLHINPLTKYFWWLTVKWIAATKTTHLLHFFMWNRLQLYYIFVVFFSSYQKQNQENLEFFCKKKNRAVTSDMFFFFLFFKKNRQITLIWRNFCDIKERSRRRYSTIFLQKKKNTVCKCFSLINHSVNWFHEIFFVLHCILFFPYCTTVWKLRKFSLTLFENNFVKSTILLKKLLKTLISLNICHCFFCKNSVKLTFSQINHSVNWIHKILFVWYRFLLFSRLR